MNTMSPILIVEDDKSILNVLTALLKTNGYESISAVTGLDALSAYYTAAPCLVLLDLGLPDIDGTAVLQQIRQHSGVPVIVISARGQESEKVAALDMGADDYVTKPFAVGELLARIRVALRKHAPRPEKDEIFVLDTLKVDFERRKVYVEGNEIHLTSKAKQLLELVPEELRKPELTADWEMKLGNIAKGKMKQETFLKEIRNYTCDIVDEIKTGQGTFRHDNLTNKICPNCGKKLLAVNGKNAKMLVCQDRECGYKETLSRTTNARCPKCHKRMEMYVKGKEETFICACGYKEKLSAFQARRAKEGAGVNKRDVQKYMRQQQKEAKEPVNNAFAQALAGLKLE